MPKKKGKKGKKGGKKKKAAVAAEKEEVKGKSKIFLKIYQTNCMTSDSVPIPRVITACRECLEEGKPLTKVKISIKFTPYYYSSHLLIHFPVFCGDLSRSLSSKRPQICRCQKSQECKSAYQIGFCSNRKSSGCRQTCHAFPSSPYSFAAII